MKVIIVCAFMRALAVALSLSLPLCQGLALAFPGPRHVSFLLTCPHCLALLSLSTRGSMPHSDPSQAACPWIKGENYTEMSLKTCSSGPPTIQPAICNLLLGIVGHCSALSYSSLLFVSLVLFSHHHTG